MDLSSEAWEGGHWSYRLPLGRYLTFDLLCRITGGPFDQDCVSSSHSIKDPDLKVGGGAGGDVSISCSEFTSRGGSLRQLSWGSR